MSPKYPYFSQKLTIRLLIKFYRSALSFLPPKHHNDIKVQKDITPNAKRMAKKMTATKFWKVESR